MVKTEAKTVRAFLEDLLKETRDNIDPELPQIRGQFDSSEADVDEVLDKSGKDDRFVLKLTDGTRFNIIVEKLL